MSEYKLVESVFVFLNLNEKHEECNVNILNKSLVFLFYSIPGVLLFFVIFLRPPSQNAVIILP